MAVHTHDPSPTGCRGIAQDFATVPVVIVSAFVGHGFDVVSNTIALEKSAKPRFPAPGALTTVNKAVIGGAATAVMNLVSVKKDSLLKGAESWEVRR